jgi:predicted ATPase
VQDLYLGGLNRHVFLPFIAELEKHCVVYDMDSETGQCTACSTYLACIVSVQTQHFEHWRILKRNKEADGQAAI